ncbi:MAG: DUF2339 domain-containing protein, partial [Rhodothermales bacterium]|nr:DUF2339 domain-containing protein [Rhodothermales bacterium]
MTIHDNSRLERRIAELEERVRMLERGQPDAAGAALPAPEVERGPRAANADSSPEPSLRGLKGPVSQVKARPPRSAVGSDAMASIKKILRSEDLINKVGIFLLLIGLAFLFKWGIDRGWITPVVRVAFGAVLGMGLVVFGARIRSRRVRYGQVLVGGGIATLYITLFSAFQLYELLSYPVALTLMTGVTALSFALSLRQADVVLAIIATAGGLGTPFLLLETPSSILWLVVYTSLIAACAIAIFFEKGWRSL